MRSAIDAAAPGRTRRERRPTVKMRTCCSFAAATACSSVRTLPMSAPSESSTIDPDESFAPRRSPSERVIASWMRVP